MTSIVFDWNKQKAKANIKKHGVSFEDASTCFEDDFAEIFADENHSNDEERFVLIGMSLTLRTLVVTYTERDNSIENTIINRIISARKATKSEFQYYWEKRKGK